MRISRVVWLSLALISLAGVGALLHFVDGRARGAPIRVAFAGPTSGTSAADGLSAVRAIELIFDRVNANGGVSGRPLELDVYDDRNDPEQARANASRIADQSETVAVIGHNFSTCSIAAGEVYQQRGIPAVASAATSVAVTRDNPWYFRTIYNDRAQGRKLLLYVHTVLGAERFGIIHESEEYGDFLAGVMTAAAPELGIELDRSWRFDPAAPNLGARLDAIAADAKSAAPPVLVLAMQPDAGVAVVERLRERGYDGTLVVSDALASQAFVGGLQALPGAASRPGHYTTGIYASTPFLFDTGGRRASAFLRDYVARHEESPDWYAAFAADAATVIVEALRRNGLSPTAENVERDRAALRDAIAAIGASEPVYGLTGPTWFDAVGDVDKAVPMGILLDGEIVSAFAQLRPLPGVSSLDDLPDVLEPDRAVRLGDRVLYRTDVARVGVRAHRFDDIAVEDGTFGLSFDLWFRHQSDRGVEDLAFTNAVEPIDLGPPVEEVVDGALRYRLYRAQGVFHADAVDADYGEHALSMSLRPRERTAESLVFAVDSVGMGLGREQGQAARTARARRLVEVGSGWAVRDLFFFQDDVEEPALGHPSFLGSGARARTFSQLTIGIIVGRPSFSLRGLLPERARVASLAVGLLGSLALLILRGRPRLRWLLQAAMALLVLMAAEPLLGNWVQSRGIAYDIAQLDRLFGFLWWLVPALFVNVAIDRFLWQPAEVSTGHPVPTLLRYFVAILVYLFAVFGVIAFVYDYTLTGLLATSGVLAMIIGLAVQLNITNIFAGVALNLERPFRVGDWIMVHGRLPDPDSSIIGMVTDINWRTTRLKTADDTVIVIPNGIISEKTITNFMGPNEMSRFSIKFTVDQGVPSETVIPIIQRAVDAVIGSENEGPLADPAPTVRIHDTSERGIVYVVRYRLIPREVSPHKARHTVHASVIRELRREGIELAVPRRRIREETRDEPAP